VGWGPRVGWLGGVVLLSGVCSPAWDFGNGTEHLKLQTCLHTGANPVVLHLNLVLYKVGRSPQSPDGVPRVFRGLVRVSTPKVKICVNRPSAWLLWPHQTASPPLSGVSSEDLALLLSGLCLGRKLKAVWGHAGLRESMGRA
jgi:hypothetical protein